MRELYLYFYYLFQNERRTLRPILMMLGVVALACAVIIVGAVAGNELAAILKTNATVNNQQFGRIIISAYWIFYGLFQCLMLYFFGKNSLIWAFPRSFYTADLIRKSPSFVSWSHYFLLNG